MLHCDQSRTLHRTDDIEVNHTRSGLNIRLTSRSAERQWIVLLHLVPAELIEGGLEVVQDDSICKAFKDEGEFPERVDVSDWKDGRHGEEVDDYEDDADGHA